MSDQPSVVTLEAVKAVDLTPWKTVRQSATYAQTGPRTIYREIKAGRLRAAVIGGRRDYRIHQDWLDEWLVRASTPIEVRLFREVRR